MDCPHHCWYAYMEIGGNHKTRIPDVFKQFIADLHAMCSHNKNPIVAWGLSRGGRWLEELAREKGHYLDIAIIIGGYPESRCQWQSGKVAEELIKVKKPIVCMVHYSSDTHCSAIHYPYWHAVFERAMARRNSGEDIGTGFMNFVMPGGHDLAGELFYSWDIYNQSLWAEGAVWFHSMWDELLKRRC